MTTTSGNGYHELLLAYLNQSSSISYEFHKQQPHAWWLPQRRIWHQIRLQLRVSLWADLREFTLSPLLMRGQHNHVLLGSFLRAPEPLLFSSVTVAPAGT